ncbi:hypothetical protein [Paraburkholderia aspalathi]|uniref:hypothetical protein n=1 Tax=Paraburkholderia aspalathi TaxID=1324617 RepID=UPI001B1C7D4A|nr:hypothetical protein [Paraburkholderia aspalathi]CAE6842653.1 hypothetical protein R20943_07189 [Paraburkholderia aspalathi]
MSGLCYEDACEEIVTRAEAKAEIDKHDCEGGWEGFLAEAGDRPEYEGRDVLDWLGY